MNGNAPEQLLVPGNLRAAIDISPDGKYLTFTRAETPRVADFLLPLTGQREPVVLGQLEAHFSPDGHWTVYISDESGRAEAYVQPFPPSGAKWQISNNGAVHVSWRVSGEEIFFVTDDRKLYAVDVHPGSTFEYGTPKYLFDVHSDINTRNSFAASRDGQRFLVTTLLDNTASPINVVMNWTAGLKQQ